jgi:hypothetical protein
VTVAATWQKSAADKAWRAATIFFKTLTMAERL